MNETALHRRQAMLDYDTAMRTQFGVLCGVDEAGRGPLAGDVYAAAVILGEDHGITGLDDSKKLTEKRREALFDEIQEKAEAWCIATASIAEIEELNILGAAMLAMRRAVAGLQTRPAYVLVDGNRWPDLPEPGETVVKGDATSASIAAASILAKVARDRYMLEQAALYPEYGFAKHKGYGTKAHYEALRQYGLSPIHRPSFLKNL
jgi:ribonuclease HII